VSTSARPAPASWLLRAVIAVCLGGLVGTGLLLIESKVPAEASTTLTGVDVSRWDHPNGAAIDWPRVKAAGRSFAIVKATQSTTYTNPYFADDYAKARAAGLVVGAYHFAHPRLPISTAADEARFYVRTVGSFKGTGILPPVLDLECDGSGKSCYNGTRLTVSQLQQWTKLWLDTAQAMTGRVPIIYTYDSFWRNAMGNTRAFTGYPLWYARYTTTTPTAATLPGGWSRWAIWQYTSTGTTPGINRDVGDINRFNGDLASLNALADGRRALGTPGQVVTPAAATTGAGWVKLTWQPPLTNGGAPVVDYTVSIDGGEPQVTPTRSFVAAGLAAGDHIFTIRARSIAGDGQPIDVPVTVSATGDPVPVSPAKLTISMPTSGSATSSLLASARLVRTDTGQAVGGAELTWRRVPEKGRELAPLKLTTTGDGTVSTSMKFNVDTWTKLTSPAGPGLSAAAATRGVRITPWIGATMNQRYVPRRSTVTLAVRASYLLAGETVHRQRLVSGRWKTVSSRKLGSDGRTAFGVYTSVKGVKYYRVLIPATSAHAAKASPSFLLRTY
jgi:GH25 family lysozyme M1 (1,4-beta-N-acetylmuramidase)